MGLQVGGDEAMRRAYFRQLPRSYLYYGYTTLVDLIVFDRAMLDDFRNAPLHPDLLDCGEALPLANGYPMAFLPPEQRFKAFGNFLHDPAQASSIPAEYKPGDHTPEAAVARVKRAGGSCVKMFFERGFGADRDLPVPSADIFARVRAAATRERLPLIVHANGLEGQAFAVQGHADVIAHGMWHWGALDREQALPPSIKTVLDRIAAERIGYQPTLRVLYGELAYFDPAYLDTPAIAKVVPKSLAAWFRTPAGRAFRKDLEEKDTPDAAMVAGYERGPLRRVRQVVEYLAAKDANFLFGSDTPSGPTYGNLPGLNGFLEMRELRKAGLDLTQVLRAATINNARQFRIDAQVGTIEPGKVANLVLLARSPLESIEAYDSITTVWIHGERVPRERLEPAD
jgi:hypothetical protein